MAKLTDDFEKTSKMREPITTIRLLDVYKEVLAYMLMQK